LTSALFILLVCLPALLLDGTGGARTTLEVPQADPAAAGDSNTGDFAWAFGAAAATGGEAAAGAVASLFALRRSKIAFIVVIGHLSLTTGGRKWLVFMRVGIRWHRFRHTFE
jgi:hypothetical protein